MRILLVIISLFACQSSIAAMWTLSDIEFSDGTTASGSFDWDGTYSNVDITLTSIGGAFPEYSFEGTHIGADGGTYLYLVSDELAPSPSYRLSLQFVDNLSGGTATNIQTFSYYDYDTFDSDTPDVLASTGSVIPSVPVPAAVWLFGSALLGLGFVSRQSR